MNPLKTFIIYSSKDRELREQLESHLQALVDLKWIALWSDKEIAPGERWDKAIKKRLLDADIFLMLISVDFYNSGYIREEEFKTAIARLESGDSMVIPIIVRPCDWESYPVIKDLQVLPPGGLAVTDSDHWKDRDKAWQTIAKKLRERIQDLRAERDAAQQKREAELEAERAAAVVAQRLHDEQTRREQHEQAEREAVRIAAEEAEQQKVRQQRLDNERIAADKARLEEERRQQQAAVEQEKQRATEQEAARLHAEQERERQRQDAHNAAWSAATGQHSAAAYEQFLLSYPNSAHAREARHHIKTLRTSGRKPVAWGRWAGIGAGILGLVFVIWYFNRSKERDRVTPSHPVPTKESPVAPVVTIEKIGGLDYAMTRVTGGTYLMGSPINEPMRDMDECQHSVTVATFSIGQTEVTQAQWESVMGNNPSRFKGEKLPVETVSWNDIQAFIKKLNAKTGKNFRLPTEQEWEYAARGGARSKGYKYAGSNNSQEVAWYFWDLGENKSHPVGAKKANELGLYDMSGNVWELCQDKYSGYPGCVKLTTSSRVARGGSWGHNEKDCRLANRDSEELDSRNGYIGLRLARD